MSNYNALEDENTTLINSGGVADRLTGDPYGGGSSDGSNGSRVKDRGLSNSNKVQVVNIRNCRTGELMAIDKKAARISRMRKRVFAWANAIKNYLPARGIGMGYRKVMITLTYAKVDDWKPNHIRDFNKELRRRLGVNLVAYAWVGELQERGAVHYHIELICKKGTRIPMPDKSGMWKHGMSKIETARSVFYICAYFKKAYQKWGEFPKGMRTFGVWIAPDAVPDMARWLFRLSSIPEWLSKEITKEVDKWGKRFFRNPGGGWCFGGKVYHSPFEYLGLQTFSI